MTENKTLKTRLCLQRGCTEELALSQIYCKKHRPPNFEVELPGGGYVRWADHPDYEGPKPELAVVG